MTDESVVPATYEQWRHWIEVRAGIRLTPSYISERVTELQDASHSSTSEFARLYGSDHLQRTIAWFLRAADELSGTQR